VITYQAERPGIDPTRRNGLCANSLIEMFVKYAVGDEFELYTFARGITQESDIAASNR
jgi:hypothetical protein